MYHGIVEDPNRVPTRWSPRHTITLDAFRAHMSLLRADGWRTLSSPEMQSGPHGCATKRLCITFDDGHDSDPMAGEILARCGFNAIFFITLEHLERPGFVTQDAVRALSRQGFVIGSHGVTHTRMNALPEMALRWELYESRRRLEELIDAPVKIFACPFGAYNRRVVARARSAGYSAVMTSNIGRARLGASEILPRLPIRNDTRLDEFRTMMSESVFMTARRRLRAAALRRRNLIKTILDRGWRGWKKQTRRRDGGGDLMA